MAKEEPEKEGEKGAAEAPKNSKKKWLLIGGGVLLLLLAAGIPTAIFLMKGSGSEELEADAAHGEAATLEGSLDEDELSEGEEALGALFPLDTFVLNLSDGKFIRLAVQLEFLTRDIPLRFYTRQVPIRDSLIELITSSKSSDFSGENGREDFKKQVKEKVNEILRKEEVKRVYFTQFVIQ